MFGGESALSKQFGIRVFDRIWARLSRAAGAAIEGHETAQDSKRSRPLSHSIELRSKRPATPQDPKTDQKNQTTAGRTHCRNARSTTANRQDVIVPFSNLNKAAEFTNANAHLLALLTSSPPFKARVELCVSKQRVGSKERSTIMGQPSILTIAGIRINLLTRLTNGIGHFSTDGFSHHKKYKSHRSLTKGF